MTSMLYIAAKAPRIGFAKTRLGRAIGDEPAIALYKAFLRDLAARFADAPSAHAPFKRGWYVTPPDAWAEMAPLVATRAEERVLFQGTGDWTERQRELFRGAEERGEGRVVLIASDSPQVTVEAVARAFDDLDRHDLVFGPTYDGGYYLIGMRGQRPCEVLRGVSMSTGTVLEDLLARAARAGLSAARVEATFDVDEAGDLEPLRQTAFGRRDLAATRAVLERLGMPGPLVPETTEINRNRLIGGPR